MVLAAGQWDIDSTLTLKPEFTDIYENDKASSKVLPRVKLALYNGSHFITGN